MKKFIRELSEHRLSQEGYYELLNFVHFMLKKYQWPKTLIGARYRSNQAWKKNDIIELSHQLVVFLYESKKLKYLYKVSDQYVDYYFTQILISYVSKTIKENQNKTGLSYESVKRIATDILKADYFEKDIGQKRYWWKHSNFESKPVTVQEVEEQVKYLPRIPLDETTKHYKALVKNAVYSIFSLIEMPFEESIIFSTVYNLFDQSQFKNTADIVNKSLLTPDININRINQAVDKILEYAEKKDIPVVCDYLFSDEKITINELGTQYNIPNSTIHSKINKFKQLIIKHYLPQNEEEGVEFFKKLSRELDKTR